jgi:uncharacterized protein (UPF0335 family)
MPKTHTETETGVIDAEALNDYVSRVASLMREQQGLADDIKNVCASADEAGVASKREIRKLARERLMEPDVLDAQLTRMQDLRDALRSFVTTPLGEAAMRSAESEPANGAMAMPRPFAEQPVHEPQRRRGRPRQVLFDQEHPFGTA